MPKALSVDLRQRVVNAYKAGEGTVSLIKRMLNERISLRELRV